MVTKYMDKQNTVRPAAANGLYKSVGGEAETGNTIMYEFNLQDEL